MRGGGDQGGERGVVQYCRGELQHCGGEEQGGEREGWSAVKEL